MLASYDPIKETVLIEGGGAEADSPQLMNIQGHFVVLSFVWGAPGSRCPAFYPQQWQRLNGCLSQGHFGQINDMDRFHSPLYSLFG